MKRILLLILAFLTAGISQGQNIFNDDFSTYILNQELSGQGLWSNVNNPANQQFGLQPCVPIMTGGICFSSNVVSNPISYSGYGTSLQSIQVAGFLDNPGRGIVPIVSSGVLYIGLVVNITTAPVGAAASDFLRINNGGIGSVAFRLIVQDGGFGYKIGIKKGASNEVTSYTQDLYNYGENVLIVLKYSYLPSFNDDVLSLYANPVYSAIEPLTPTLTTSSGFDQSETIDRVAFRLGNNTAGNMPTGFAGLVSASTTWDGLSFLPLGLNQFEANNVAISSILENGELQINSKSPLNNVQMKLYSTTGALLEQKTINIPTGSSQIGLASKLSGGMYIVQLFDENGEKSSFKIMSK